MKICLVGPGFIHADGRIDRDGEASRRFFTVLLTRVKKKGG